MGSRLLLPLWGVAIAIEWGRLPTLGNYAAFDTAIRGVLWGALLISTVLHSRHVKNPWAAWAGPFAGFLLIALFFNWAPLAPHAFFATHQPIYDLGIDSDDGNGIYGTDLAVPLRPLSADGHVSGQDPVYFPQVVSPHEDDGGYLWSPDHSPLGADMDGTVCADPHLLGDGWWVCGMD